jgi:hypothetical protein
MWSIDENSGRASFARVGAAIATPNRLAAIISVIGRKRRVRTIIVTTDSFVDQGLKRAGFDVCSGRKAAMAAITCFSTMLTEMSIPAAMSA